MSETLKSYTNQIKLNFIQYLFMSYAFILPLSKASVASFTFIFAIVIIYTQKNNFKVFFQKTLSNKVLKYFLLFILINLFSLVFVESIYLDDAFTYVKRYFYLIIPAIAIYTLIKDKYIDKVISAFLSGMFVSELVSYSIYFKLIEKKGVQASDPTPFMNHLDYSIFLVLTSLILLNKLFSNDNIKVKVFYFIFFCSTTINLFITGGRIGQLCFIFSLLVVILMKYKNKFKAILIFIVMSLTIYSLAYNFSSTFSSRVNTGISNLEEVIEKENYCTSWGIRIGSIIIAKDIILQNPIIGVGVENNIVQLRKIIKENYPDMKCISWVKSYHNQYLDVLTQFGILGFVLFMSIFVLIYKLKFKDNEFRTITLVFVITFLIAFVGDAFFYRYFIVGLFGLFLGLILSKSNNSIINYDSNNKVE